MINIGLLGTGFGREHLSLYKNIKDANVVAVFGRNETKLSQLEKEFGVAVSGNIDEMISRKEIDIIDICLPTPLHAEVIAKAVGTGKSVICETPLCYKKEELEKINKSGGRISVSSFLKYFNEYEYLKNEIESSKLGNLKVLNMQRRFCGKLTLDKIIFELMIHEIDLIAWMFGFPEWIGADEIVDRGDQSSVRATLKYSDKTISIQASSMMPSKYPFTIGYEALFDNGYLEFDCSFGQGEPEKEFNRYSNDTVEKVNLESVYPYKTMLEDFIRCEMQGITSRLDIKYAVTGMEIALGIYDKLK